MRRAVYVDKDTQKAIINAFLRVKGRSVLGNKHCSALKDIEENIAKMRSEKGINNKNRGINNNSNNRRVGKIL